MSNPPQAPAKDAPKPAAAPKADNDVPHEEENVAHVVRAKIQRGELSPAEARHLFEYMNKELDA